MANAKSKAVSRGPRRGSARPPHATLTTAFITDAASALPQGATAVTFKAPRHAVEMFAAKPAKVKALLQGYGEAVARSHLAGRAMSFRVEVDPSGRAKITPIEEAGGAVTGSSGGAAAAGEGDLERALEEARARGRSQVAEILAGDEMLSADQFAALLGTTRMTVNTKRQNRQVLGLDGAKRGFRFPSWQVGDDGKPFAALPALFERLGGGAWSVYRFLVQAHPELDGLTGREALLRGKEEDALDAAASIAEGTFA